MREPIAAAASVISRMQVRRCATAVLEGRTRSSPHTCLESSEFLMSAADPMSDRPFAEDGCAAALAVWTQGLKAQVVDPLNSEFATAAIAEFSRLQIEGTPGIYRDALEGAEISAEQLSVEPFQGVIEVVQNADDAQASEVRLALRRVGGGRALLFVHDGKATRFPDVVAMALAFVSTKREDAESKGRFGIGLKTLNALGGELTIHSGPYHARIDGNRLAPARPAKPIEGLYSPQAGHTLFELRLHPGFQPADLTAWLEALDPASLLFLDSVRAVRLLSIRSRKVLVESCLDRGSPSTASLQVARQPLTCESMTLRDPTSGRSWQRYWVDWPIPNGAPKRRHKATGLTTPIAIAIPDQPGRPGRLYTGLPLDIELGAPLSANAQFNVDTPRTGVQRDDWNVWLVDRILQLTSAVAALRFAREPASGWLAVPLIAEVAGLEPVWLREQVAAGTVRIHERLAQSVRLSVGGVPWAFNELVFESRSLERIVGEDDLRTLHPDRVPLPKQMRDRDGRWREVLDEVADATEVDVADAMRLLDLDDEQFGVRPVSWFIRFARAAIGADEGEALSWRRSIILTDGSRVIPPAPHVEAELLVRNVAAGSLAARLGLARVIDAAYLTRNPEATVVRRWLEESDLLLGDIGEKPALRALARRGQTNSQNPIELDDADLVALRDALATLDRDEQAALGLDIGKAIRVRGYRWERGKRTKLAVRPADGYLPGTLEDRSDGFAKAAGGTPGLQWIETRYAGVLKRAERNARIPAALTFFRTLGAEIAPRLIPPSRFDTRYGDPASPIEFRRLTASQKDSLSGKHATHLKVEHLSPDLAHVVEDIHRERSRKRRRERATALLATLEREWQRLYDGHETARAVYSANTWREGGTLPATWLAAAMDTPWLTTETGTPKAPRDLVVRTKANEALYGHDADVFAAEVPDHRASSPAVRALGLTTDPRVSEVVDQLAELQASGDPVSEADVLVRYAALSAAVTNVDPSADSKIGDLTVRQLRGRFGAGTRKPGLILVDGAWLPPKSVLRGRPIFGTRRAFVPDRSHSDRLWRVLGVTTPTIADCLAVLADVARQPPSSADEQVLLDTYVFLADRLADATRRERRAIAQVPLWSGREWLTQRPVYAVDDEDIADSLSAKVPLWRPPLSARSFGELLEALDVTRLASSMFSLRIGDVELVAGEPLREPYAAAISHLRDWLARHDQTLYGSLQVDWEDLADAQLALSPNLRLELRLPHRRALAVPARAHIQFAPLVLCVSSEDDLAMDDAGGRVVAELFAAGDRDKLALAWTSCWAKAQRGDRAAGMRLAEDHEDDGGLDALFAQAAASKRQPKRTTVADGRRNAAGPAKQSQASSSDKAVRRLKQADDLVVSSVHQRTGEERRGSTSQRRGLRSGTPPGRTIDRSARPAPRSAPIAYSPQEQEHLALLALQEAINGDVEDLRDFRHLQGVGADALDRLDRLFEIKSFATVMPDHVTLTANEFERALKDPTKYYLAVVAGLEEGHDTVVRIVADPVHTLTVKRSTSVVLGGLNSAERSIEIRFDGDEAQRSSP